jgi:hypothetical protein
LGTPANPPSGKPRPPPGAEQETLARRPGDEDAVASTARHERREIADGVLVEPGPTVAQRRHDRGHRSVQRHAREHIHRTKPIVAVGIRVWVT